ncbi:MAG: hypothetical protein H6Q86_3796, partial [candidate division NC10 bacterium]|nr:hypothetical protein [candidate division NC10 bacterium]
MRQIASRLAWAGCYPENRQRKRMVTAVLMTAALIVAAGVGS